MDRYEQHMADYRRKEGFMWEHAQEYHQGQTDIKFSMIRVATDRDPMRRIVRESIRIIENRKDETVHLLNSIIVPRMVWYKCNTTSLYPRMIP